MKVSERHKYLTIGLNMCERINQKDPRSMYLYMKYTLFEAILNGLILMFPFVFYHTKL